MSEDCGSVLDGDWKDEEGDIIETYRIMKGLDRVYLGKMFPFEGETRTREDSLRGKRRPFRTEMWRSWRWTGVGRLRSLTTPVVHSPDEGAAFRKLVIPNKSLGL